MRIGVISDSHGDIYGVKKAIKDMGSVDIVIHLGDYYRDAEKVSAELGREIICVKGNCDFSAGVESEKVIEAGGKKIFLTHGHNYNVKHDYISLYYKGLQEEADVVLFGHTHHPEVFEKDNILFVNPGSVSLPRASTESYALVTIEKGLVFANIIGLL